MVDSDVFGFYELLEKDIRLRSCTVTCIHNESHVVSIEKSALNAIIRKDTRVLEAMKRKWTRFLIERVSNKLYVDKLLSHEQREFDEK